ncbi:MAG: hypothetical protein ABI378_03615 [Chitinophagaceae bacterium]
MSNKIILKLALSAFGISCASASFAQDKIYFHDGRVVEAKVLELNNKEITYKRYDNLEGADYKVPRRDVDRLIYENGTEEFVKGNGSKVSDGEERMSNHKTVSEAGYGNNILSFAPIQMTEESTVGVGIQYERILDKNGIFSFYLPIAASFFDDARSYYNSSTGSYINDSKTRMMLTFFPGLKIYPAGSGRRFSYSVGPSLGFGFGTRYVSTQTYDPILGGYNTIYTEKDVFKMGLLVNNGLNFQPTKHFYLGLEFGLGFTYYSNRYSNYSIGEDPLVQFNFKMGYRF